MAILHAKLIKATGDKRLVTAWLSQVEDSNGNLVVDDEGDSITLDALEDALIKAFASGGQGRVERQHKTFGLGDVVQHFVLSREERQALGFGDGPAGAIVKLRIDDDDLWAAVKAGEVTDLSFLGLVTSAVST
jgi:hypothetical protein